MAETNFTLHSTDPNNYKLQKTFTGVNPDATSAELVETAQGFNRLTDNTYVGTKRIDKLDADSETGKLAPTLTIGEWAKLTNGTIGSYASFSYNGDGQIFTRISSSSTMYTPYISFNRDKTEIYALSGTTPKAGDVFDIAVYTSETDNYAAATVTSTFTWA